MRRKEGKTDMKYASNNIRNILIAGHAGSGKTTLTEALVYFSGAAERMGRVEDGTTISDFDPEEAKRKASLSASVVPVEYEGIKYNFIDAPGLFDFEAGEYEGIRAAESVLVCVSGRSGVTVGAEKAFQLARKNGKATMVFVSKCDLENANYFKILEDMKIRFGSTICPCVVPAKLDDGTPVYINLFSQKAFKYEGGKQIQVDLPDIGHRFQGLIEAMSEAIAETDDELMEKFFGGEPFTTEEIVEGMRKGVKDGLITPVFCGSAVNQQALDMLLFNMHKLLPSPEHEECTMAEDANGEPVELHCTESEPTAAYVFKTVADPFVGKLSYLRVISGKVTAGLALTNARTGDIEKINKPLTVLGKKQIENDGIGAGDIGAVAKLVSAKTGDTLCDASRVVKLPAPVFPLPSLFMAVTVAKKGDEGKISSALARLMEEDPTRSYETNAETQPRTATEIAAASVDYDLTIRSLQKAWEDCADDALFICSCLDRAYHKDDWWPTELRIDWGDGVLYDRSRVWAEQQQMVASGLLRPEIALAWYYDLPAETEADLQAVREKYMPAAKGGENNE